MKVIFRELPLKIKIRILLTRIHIFIIKCVAFNRVVVIGATVKGTLHVDSKKGGIISQCTFK